MEEHKYQVNMFIGQQSFVLRTNSLKELAAFTGEKKFKSESIKQYLMRLNEWPENTPASPTRPKKGSPEKKGQPETPAVQEAASLPMFKGVAIPPDYEKVIREYLYAQGAKTVKEAMQIFKKLTGLTLKRLPTKENFKTPELQRLYGMMLKGKHNGKK